MYDSCLTDYVAVSISLFPPSTLLWQLLSHCSAFICVSLPLLHTGRLAELPHVQCLAAQEDRERMAKVLPAQIAAGVPGGVAQLWHQNPQQEFWHRFMNSALQGDGSGQTGTGGGGGVGMEKMMVSYKEHSSLSRSILT